MKKIEIKNIDSVNAVKMGDDSNKFSLKPVIGYADASKCAVHFMTIEPNSHGFDYHYHEVNEEVFFIVSGKGIVRTPDGDIPVKAGDAITFPAGKNGAHAIRNASDSEKLVYVDFDAVSVPDIVHFPDSKKVMYTAPFSHGMFDEK